MTEAEALLLGEAIRVGIERHQAHRPRLYRGADGIWRCPECEPPSLRALFRCACGDVWPDASYGCGHTPTRCESDEGYGLFDPYAFTADSSTGSGEVGWRP